MTALDIATYRRLIAQHMANNDPLVMVRVTDLSRLVSAWEVMHRPNGEKPRVRVKAKEPA